MVNKKNRNNNNSGNSLVFGHRQKQLSVRNKLTNVKNQFRCFYAQAATTATIKLLQHKAQRKNVSQSWHCITARANYERSDDYIHLRGAFLAFLESPNILPRMSNEANNCVATKNRQKKSTPTLLKVSVNASEIRTRNLPAEGRSFDQKITSLW